MQVPIVFLKEFTKELILNSGKNETKRLIKEKSEEDNREFLLKKTLLNLSSNILQKEKSLSDTLPLENKESQFYNRLAKDINQQSAMSTVPRYLENQGIPQRTVQVSPLAENKQLDLGKLNLLLKDPTITIIECPGPEKNIIAKGLGKASLTKIVLHEEEIKDILKKFSDATKIPLIGGIFKAAYGNLVITAVSSEYVGSRFIINKFSLLQQDTLQNSTQQPIRNIQQNTYPRNLLPSF